MRFIVILISLLLAIPVQGQDIHHHPGESVVIDQFYSTWFRPDAPTASCCGRHDCYSPAKIERRGKQLYAERREDHKMILIPQEKIEQNRESPDGRNHLCAASAETPAGGMDTVYCFVYGAGT